jgi:hypothetical protein
LALIAALRNLREEHARTIVPAQAPAAPISCHSAAPKPAASIRIRSNEQDQEEHQRAHPAFHRSPPQV